MIFKNVTDISIPQGNVVKIHETVSGRVLWEKKLSSLAYTKAELIHLTRGYVYDSTTNIDTVGRGDATNPLMYLLDSITRLSDYNSADYEWFMDYSALPGGVCGRVDNNNLVYLDVIDSAVSIVKNMYGNIGVWVINRKAKIYDKTDIALYIRYGGTKPVNFPKLAVIPDISEIPEGVITS